MALMPRRILRTVIQLSGILLLVLVLVVFFDDKHRVLPQSIYIHLPLHHDGFVLTDITIKSCSSLNPLSSCKLDPNIWHRVEKDLYLDSKWVTSAYVHIQRKMENELKADDRVVLDVKVGKLDPSLGEKGQGDRTWESRPNGLWIERSAKAHDRDSKDTVTALDVLFGADAVEARAGWKLINMPLLLNTDLDTHLSVRKGPSHKLERPTPRIRKDGRFKIMQVADLHLSTGTGDCRDPEPKSHNGGTCAADPRTLDFVGRLLDEERPDLVILSGDQVNGETAPDTQSAVFKFAELFARRSVPYAAIFGNHDDQETPLSRAATMSLLESLPFSLSQAGPSTAEGIGNYVVEVLSGSSQHSALTIYLLDSHGLSPDEKNYQGYDWIKPNQIKWFKDTAQDLKKSHKQYSKIHMDMAFIHIPLPEYRNAENKRVGAMNEPITAPGFNSKFKDALVEEKVLVVSCGHDHVNDFCSLEMKEKTPEIWMCYGGGAGFGGYGGHGGYHRRIRFFDVDANAARISTYKRLEFPNTKEKIDEQVIVEGGKIAVG